MEKLVRNGKVAVLYSPGYGAGWYTWNTSHPECVFDPEIVKIVLGEAKGDIEEIAERKYQDYFFAGGAMDLVVGWVDIGQRFRIDEYDGYESLILEGDDSWFVAEDR